jgi:exodeoxyribonuclease V beta subunit
VTGAPARFDAATIALAGKNLVEASAGTGKTYAITTLFVRLLLEQDLEPSQVAVVTFTEAATAELRDRIRKRLVEAEAAFAMATQGVAPPDATLAALATARRTRLEADRVRLRAAIENVDEAVISTIHGFCHRMLGENAFGTRSLFDVEFATELDELRDDVVYDFWHQTLGAAPLLEAEVLSGLGIDVGWLRELVDAQRKHARVRIEPGATAATPDFDVALADVRKHASIVPVNDYLGDRTTLKNILADSSRKALMEQVDRVILGQSVTIPRKASCLFPDRVHAAWKTGTPDLHPFFAAWQRLVEACWDRAVALQHTLLAEAPAELSRRKDARGVLGFEDLLEQLARAVTGPAGDALKQALRERFRAVLIDEFQDTDPVQLEVFDTAFGDGTRPMFLIGDPKQAIYAFRGGDVFTYLAGGRNARRYEMHVNWRSDAGLVRAVNYLFHRDGAFVNPNIGYTPVEARDGAANAFGLPSAGAVAPLRIALLEREDPAASALVNKPIARSAVARAVAADIVRLLRDGASITTEKGTRRVAEGDIAVLTRTNRQCQYVQEALAQRGVHAVLMGDQTVFESAEAADLQLLIGAVLDPTSAYELKRALSTRIVGLDGGDLLALEEDPARWNAWAARFRDLHDTWTQHGFMRMFRQTLAETDAVQTLLRAHDGERALTNLLHLGELLHRAATEEHLGPAGVAQWLRAQRRAKGSAKAEHAEIRLESDAGAVRLLTVHKAKGLEFPVVYCPYLWDGSGGKVDKAFVYHDATGAAVLHVGLDHATRAGSLERAAEEALAEEVRVAYVALTRAKHRCVVTWGGFRGVDKAAAARLLHPDGPAAKVTDEELLDDLRALEAASGGAIEVVRVPWADDEERLTRDHTAAPVAEARTARRLAIWQRTSSFSALVRGHGAHGAPAPEAVADPDDTGADHDEIVEAGEAGAGEPPSSVAPLSPPAPVASVSAATPRIPVVPASFRRGRETGNFFHRLFELVDFVALDAGELDRVVGEQLDAFGLARRIDDAIRAARRAEAAQLVRETLATPLLPVEGLRLDRVCASRRLNELEFHLPVLETLSTKRLAGVFAEHPGDAFPTGYADRVRDLGFRELTGHLKGVIDLIFEHDGRYYVADYKTNHLGDFAEQYDRETMTRAMADAHYVLQYHLYALATDRYLRRTVPGYTYEDHFGGALYLFVKGMRPGAPPGSGIFFERPPRARMEALSRVFGEEAAWR